MAIIERVWGKATQPIDVESENTVKIIMGNEEAELAK